MSNPASLRMENVTVDFGGLRALSSVTIEIKAGEVVGIIGPNGAGKTTLFNVLTGLVTPASGSLYVNGEARKWPRIHELADIGISRTLQGVGLFGELSVSENLLVGATHSQKPNLFLALFGLNGRTEGLAKERVESTMRQFGISQYGAQRASDLPYPIAKRVALARAVISNPTTLLLDEPAGGLGVEDISWLKDFVLRFRRDRSVLLVEHHMDVIMSVCDRIYVLNFGELIAHGTPEEIRKNPAVIAAYLGGEATE